MDKNLEGIVAIPVTPFAADGSVDEKSLRREVGFALGAKVNGLLVPVNASEWFTLSDEERRRIVEVIIGEVAGQIPVVVGVTAQSNRLAIEFAQHARRVGAGAVNAMPPHVLQLDEDGCFEFYRELSRAAEMPVIVQNYYPPLGTPMSVGLLCRLVTEVENVCYVKEETSPEPLKITGVLKALGVVEKLRGVFGGQGGLYLIDELNRGVSGNMPALHAADVLVSVWELWRQGATDKARRVHGRLLPLLTFERCYGGSVVYKEVLRRRGVIATAFNRTGTKELDEFAGVELSRILNDIADLLG